MNQWVKRAIVAVPLLIAVVYAAILVYARLINEPDPEFTVDDALVLASATTPAEPAGTAAVVTATDPPATDSPAVDPTAVDPTAVDGAWQIAAGSEFGYRVDEVLGGVSTTATGRGQDISGSITIDGPRVTAAEFSVAVASIESDNGLRDQQFRGRVMDTAEFPEASFTLTQPIELPEVPAVDGSVRATATGELTMHGVTRQVTFDVEAVRGTQRIAVVGSIPIVFADYAIDNPSTAMVTTEDHGLLEFNLAFEPA